jgi:uncharacterized protein YgiM (DUF1202 family)
MGINDLGGAMLRLTFFLCSGLFLALWIGGRDHGQMRPGLARADAEAEAVVLTAGVAAVETVVLASAAPDVAAVPVVAVAAVEPEVVASVLPTVDVAEATPVAVAPVPTVEENQVFTLSNYADPVPETLVTAEPAAEGEIWYVDGNSVNVRAGPSTDDEVVGKLSRGEATLLVSREGEDWARIRIEGDGIEGYVATRFLSPEAP